MKRAFNIVNIVKIYDQQKFLDYVKGHAPTVEAYDGKFLVKGDLGEILEGKWPNNLIVIYEFPSIEQFKKWYYSDDYLPWKEMRQSSADVNVILTEEF